MIQGYFMRPPYTQAIFLKSAARVEQLPADVGYEVAFAGRSNAGKSSALNGLTGIHQLARISKTPGRTQLINLFTLGDDDHRLVDLPGYGYAKVSKHLKQEWQTHLAHYLEVRQSLRGLILLMDIRHPLKTLDEALIDWAIAQQLPIHLLLTKADKLSRGAAQNVVLQVRQRYDLLQDQVSVQAFSVLKKQGIETLVAVLDRWFEFTQK